MMQCVNSYMRQVSAACQAQASLRRLALRSHSLRRQLGPGRCLIRKGNGSACVASRTCSTLTCPTILWSLWRAGTPSIRTVCKYIEALSPLGGIWVAFIEMFLRFMHSLGLPWCPCIHWGCLGVQSILKCPTGVLGHLRKGEAADLGGAPAPCMPPDHGRN